MTPCGISESTSTCSSGEYDRANQRDVPCLPSTGCVPSPALVIGTLGCHTQQGSSANASPVSA